MLTQFPEIDYVCLGEADHAFPELVEQVLAGDPGEPPPGMVGREMLASGYPVPPDPCDFLAMGLDAIPCPDFDDYFARVH